MASLLPTAFRNAFISTLFSIARPDLISQVPEKVRISQGSARTPARSIRLEVLFLPERGRKVAIVQMTLDFLQQRLDVVIKSFRERGLEDVEDKLLELDRYAGTRSRCDFRGLCFLEFLKFRRLLSCLLLRGSSFPRT
jgi:hypothetical protein